MPTLVRKKTTAPMTKAVPKINDVSSLIQPVSARELILAALFYGRSSTGKTTVSSTFPKPILHLDIREKGTDSIADVKGIDTISVDHWDTLEDVYWFLKKNPKYKTVVLDAATQLQDLAIDKCREEENNTGDDQVSKRMWGMVSGKMKTWIINYRDLIESGINVVFLAHDRTSEGEDGEDGELTPSVGPRLMPSVASVLTAGVTLTGNTFIRESMLKLPGGKLKRDVQYCMRLGPHAYYNTKVRMPKGSYVPEYLEDPTYEKLIQIMKGEFKTPVAEAVPETKPTLKRRV